MRSPGAMRRQDSSQPYMSAKNEQISSTYGAIKRVLVLIEALSVLLFIVDVGVVCDVKLCPCGAVPLTTKRAYMCATVVHIPVHHCRPPC